MAMHNDSAKILHAPSPHVSIHSEKPTGSGLESGGETGVAVSVQQVEHVPEGTASPGKALFMLLKAFVGTGVIFLPGS